MLGEETNDKEGPNKTDVLLDFVSSEASPVTNVKVNIVPISHAIR